MKRFFTMVALAAMIIHAGCTGGLRSGEKKNRSAGTETEADTGIPGKGEAYDGDEAANGNGVYKGYYTGYNERYGYGMSTLIYHPAGRRIAATAGVRLVNGSATLRLSRFQEPGGDPDPIEKAYRRRETAEALKQNCTRATTPQGTTADGKQFSQVTIRQGDEYYTIAASTIRLMPNCLPI